MLWYGRLKAFPFSYDKNWSISNAPTNIYAMRDQFVVYRLNFMQKSNFDFSSFIHIEFGFMNRRRNPDETLNLKIKSVSLLSFSYRLITGIKPISDKIKYGIRCTQFVLKNANFLIFSSLFVNEFKHLHFPTHSNFIHLRHRKYYAFHLCPSSLLGGACSSKYFNNLTISTGIGGGVGRWNPVGWKPPPSATYVTVNGTPSLEMKLYCPLATTPPTPDSAMLMPLSLSYWNWYVPSAFKSCVWVLICAAPCGFVLGSCWPKATATMHDRTIIYFEMETKIELNHKTNFEFFFFCVKNEWVWNWLVWTFCLRDGFFNFILLKRVEY